MRSLWLTLLFICSLSLTQAQKVYTLESIPKPSPPQSYVSNPDGVLSASAEAAINRVLQQLEDSTTAQVAVAVVQSIGDEVPGDFRTELFRYWGIGQRENDNGLLILLVMDQRRMEFEVGYGLEGILTDIMCKRIQETYMVPLAKEGDFDGAVTAGVMQVYQILIDPNYRQEVYAESLSYGESLPLWRQPISIIALILFGIGYFLSAIIGYAGRGKALSKQPKYVINQHNDGWVTAKFSLFNIGLPVVFYAWQEMNGTLRVFEFWLFVYGLFMLLLLEKRFRLNRYIAKDTADKLPQDRYMQLAKSHSNGWLAATIFFPLPFLFYSIVNKIRMKKMRYAPVMSDDGITQLTLLNEKSDDTFLKAYQLVEENIKSVDYDVWQNDITNQTKIFRYENFGSKYKECPNCKGKTYCMTKNVTITASTYTSAGVGEKTYNCKACNFENKERYTIAKKEHSSSSGSGGSGGGGGGGFGGGSSGGGGAGSSW